jgi:hypothetical protein
MAQDKAYTDAVAHVEAHLKADGRKVQVVGHLVDGKLELDPDSLNQMKAKFPNSRMVFVAVNAPFDPVTAA